MNKMIFILLSLISFSLSSSEIDYSELLKIIEREEAMLVGSNKNNITLRYRHFELMSEKLKITKHFENLNFIKAKQKDIKAPRKRFFKKTLSLYNRTKKAGLTILKKSPNTRYAANIYLSMAQNSKEYAYDDLSARYLKLSISRSKKKTHIWYLATVLLAEEYYNKKKYKTAAKLFASVIYNSEDEWHTKNLFNYGWCLFKTHKFSLAIDLLEESYKLSSNKNYIDLREQLESSMAVFYTLGKQVQRGIKFISQYNKTPFKAYFNLLKQASNKGLYAESKEVISILLDEKEYKTQIPKQIELTLFLFDHYKQYKKDQELYKVAMSLKNYKLKEYQAEEAIYKLKDQVKAYQIILKASYNKHDETEIDRLLNRTLDFFNLLAIIDLKNSHEYFFYSGESLFSVEKYKESIPFYKLVLNNKKVKSDNKFKTKSMDSIYAAIENSNFQIDKKKVILEYAYSKNIELYYAKQETIPVYNKLFNLYLSNASNVNMMNVLNLLKKNWPKQETLHKKLFTITLDFAIENKDVDLLASKIKLIKNKTYAFNKKEIDQLELILSTILFNRNLKFEKDSDFSSAIAGYKSIFFNLTYPDSTRQKSAFKLATIYNDTSIDEEVLKWIKKSHSLHKKTKKNLSEEYHAIAQKMALKQNFTSAANINKFIIENNCSHQEKNEGLLLETISFDLTNQYLRKALYSYDHLKKCSKTTLRSQEKILDYLFLNEDISNYVSFSARKDIDRALEDQIVNHLVTLYWKYVDIPDSSNKVRDLETALISRKQTDVIKLRKNFSLWKNKTNSFISEKIVLGEKFDAEIFNNKLSSRFETMGKLIKEGDKLITSKKIHIILKVYATFNIILKNLKNEVENFAPKGVDSEFKIGFLKQMKSIANNFSKQAIKYDKLVSKISHDNEFLSPIYITEIKSQEFISYDL